MEQGNASAHRGFFKQVYLLERDAGLLCRILGLYAARGLDVAHTSYRYAAQHVMMLEVRVDDSDASATTEAAVQSLIGKAATLIGVIAATEAPAEDRAVVGNVLAEALA